MNHACEDNNLEAKFFRAVKKGQDSDLPERVAFVATRCVYVCVCVCVCARARARTRACVLKAHAYARADPRVEPFDLAAVCGCIYARTYACICAHAPSACVRVTKCNGVPFSAERGEHAPCQVPLLISSPLPLPLQMHQQTRALTQFMAALFVYLSALLLPSHPHARAAILGRGKS